MDANVEDSIPTPLFAAIIPKLIVVLEHTQRLGGVVTPQAKQTLLQTTNDFKSALAQAKDYASALPGGELNFREQDELIAMLEKLRDHRRQELVLFAQRVASISDTSAQASDIRMEIDSTASTPFGS
ncbi:hypothetical protein PAXRUDRAFT_251678 [Paxillus rubicundulus Ve08.2h10]|uniref:Unplaced genomic scaffold scaffold_1294, whole genome shotgun sequence n=1 Tax=Paxillus rubicundulus Ve08.2h10 TaxID=930991 RepID=A0A0D0D8J9_9AGAM|nr:hypothetical protein PAXRUDRAFT_251678 [Paxillus rubicundulus Ve08.2h10]